LVVGGGTGIGLACARALCADEGRVFISGRREAPLAAAASGDPIRIAYGTGDATNEQDMGRIVAQALEFLGALDTVVVSAGAIGITGIMDASLAEFSRIVNGNLFPVFLAIRHTAQHLIESRRGSFIAISSVYGLVGLRKRAAYSAAKAGINGMIRSIALDLADKGVRANAICPGFIETELSLDMISKEADPQAALQERRAMHPSPRAGTTQEVGAMAAFLASDNAAWITGQTYPVDGGYTAR
jgi:NAD(P)-dependent dehydrogenase (short-subunit alcohol dehydrogenase family)